MCMSVLPVHMCTVFVAWRGQKIALDPLKLVMKMVVSYYVGAGTQTQDLCKGSKLSHLMSYLSSPASGFFFFTQVTVFLQGTWVASQA